MSNQGMPPIADDELSMPWGSDGRRIRAVEKPCATCDKPFLSPASMSRKYCSQTCYQARPSKARTADCEQCGKPFRPWEPAAKYCSHVCYSKARRGPRVAHRKRPRLVTATGHPIAPPCGVVAYARIVLYDKIGSGEHPCTWCAKPLTWKFGLSEDAIVADHLDWDWRNDVPDNLVPSCRKCNAHRTRKGDRTLIADDEPTVMRGKQRTRAVQRYCNMCGTPFLTVAAVLKQGKGRYCSHRCANAQLRGVR
jgi:hypothetical protein